MKTTDNPSSTVALEQVNRPNLNAAAARIAAAFGLTITHRESQFPPGGRLVRTWSCLEASTGEYWTMELLCLPAVWGQEGWMGCVKISRYGVRALLDKWFVSFSEHVFGRKATKLTRERFCAWAATLEPGSLRREANPTVKSETEEVV